MTRIYLAALICAAIFFAYFIGRHVESIKCDGRIADAISQRIIIDTKIIEETNETVFHTGLRDVRRILHEKYTITE